MMNQAIGIDTAKAKRTCSMCGGLITKGEKLLKVTVSTFSFKTRERGQGSVNLCLRCLRSFTYSTLPPELQTAPKRGLFTDTGEPNL